MKGLLAQLKHDFIIEYRNWPQILALLLFMWSIAYVIYKIRKDLTGGEFNFLFWIFLLLISINVAIRGSSHADQSERMLIYSLVRPTTILASRIIFNILYLFGIATAFYFAMLLLFYPDINFNFKFFGLIAVGSISIGSVLAFIAAISRHINSQNTSMSVLSIPLLIPVIITLNSIGGNLLMGNQLQSVKYILLSGITMISIALSLILFPFIWKD